MHERDNVVSFCLRTYSYVAQLDVPDGVYALQRDG